MIHPQPNYAKTAAELGLYFPRPFTLQATLDRLEVHHSVYPRGQHAALDQVELIHQQHLDKGWNGTFYNIGLDPWTGLLYELRGVGHRSTHQAPTAVTVVIFGDMRTDQLSNAAQASLRTLAELYGGTDSIYGHQERPYATACPGDIGMATVRRIRGDDAGALLELGDDNFVVAGLQIHLTTLGYISADEPYSGFGLELADAIEGFQAAAGLPVDGDRWAHADQQALVTFLAFLETLPAPSSAPAEQPPTARPAPTQSDTMGSSAGSSSPAADPPEAVTPTGSSQPAPSEQPPAVEQPKAPTPAELKLPNPRIRQALVVILTGAIGIGASLLGLETELENAGVAISSVVAWIAGQIVAAMHTYTNAKIVDRIEKGLS